MGPGMTAKRWANEGSHPNMHPFVRWDEARDAADLELTDPTVPWVYFYKLGDRQIADYCGACAPHLTLIGRFLAGQSVNGLALPLALQSGFYRQD